MNILVIQGNPDPAGGHFGHALAGAYTDAARAAGHEVRTIEVAKLDFPFLRHAAEWQGGQPVEAIRKAQADIGWSEHLLMVFPLWLGDMPAVLKAFLEQALRPGFAIDEGQPGKMPKKLLKGRSARIVVTMGMPAFFYRIYYRAHSVKSLKRNILEFCGVSPVRTTLIGMVEGKPAAREAWLAGVAKLLP
ncbi:MAG TPA: NAD(P)H-dependent oxidoreductase [Burkholderiales bacterium]